MVRLLRTTDPDSTGQFAADPELVGRARESAFLARHAAEARGGTVRGVLVRGPRGVGKSALLRQEAARQAALGSTVLHVTGRGDRTPLSAARELFASAGIVVAGLEDPDPELVYAVFRSLHQRVVELCASAPLCLVLDDFCACDHVTAKWVDFLVRRSADLPLLVLAARGTGSRGQVEAVVADLVSLPCCEALELAALAPEPVAELVAAVLGGTPDEDFAEACHRLSGGYPRHLRSLLADLLSEGARPDESGRLRVEWIGPKSSSAVLGRRLQDKPDRVRVVAAAAAVLGPEDRDYLPCLAGLAASVVDEILALLRRDHLLDDGVPAEFRRWFRRAVLNALPPAEVDELRARTAVLFDDAGRPVEAVARHLVEMTTLGEAWMPRVLREAAAVVSRHGSPATAAKYLAKVLDHEPDNIVARAELAEQSANTDPATAFRQASAAFGLTSDPALRVRLAVLCARLGTEPEAARSMLATVSRELAGPPEANGAADLRALVSATLLEVDLADRATARGALDRMRDTVPPSGATTAQRCLLGVLSEATMWFGGTAAVAVAQARRALSDQAVLGVGATLSAATVLRCAGEVAESIAVLDRAVDDFGRRGDALALSRVLAHRAMTRLGLGDLLRAERDAFDAHAYVERHSWQDHELRPRIALAAVAANLGQTERADRLLDGVPQALLATRTTEYREFLHTRAWTRFGHDDLDGALEDLYRCGRSMSEVGMHSPVLVQWWSDAAVMAAVLGRREDVVSVVLQGADLLSSWTTRESTGLALMARGLVTGRDRAVDLLTRAVEHFADLPSGSQHARAQLLLGWACFRTGDEKVARAQLRSAVVVALRCDHRALADRARQLLLDAGGRMRLSDDVELAGLTASERRVAGMAATGATNREIADALFVTLRTVELHLTRVYRKLGLSSRTQLSSALGFREDLDVLAVTARSSSRSGW